MKAEIIAVGSELLIGDVVNSNAAWISRELATLGIDVHYHVTVGDNPARIQETVAQAVSRSDILIFTGGLGPTDDDLTVATLADYFQAPLISDGDSEARIQKFFITRDMPMSATNLKQALRPNAAIPLVNPVGTAPGLAWDVSPQVGKPTFLLAFPGVPKELMAMWPQGRDFIRQKQREVGEEPQVLLIQYLHFFGIGESKLGEMLSSLMQSANPTVAPYVGQAEVRIRVAAKAPTQDEAQALIAPVQEEIIRRCGDYYYGEDEASLEARVAQYLIENGQRLAVAESCTGGLISSRLTDIPDSSDYTFINMITYGNAEKSRFLGVRPETLAAVGAVSPEVAAEMAVGIRRQAGCEFGLSITGIAGPEGGSREKPVGLAYIAISGPGERLLVKKVLVNQNYLRNDIKHWFSQYALYYLMKALHDRLETDYPALSQMVA